MAKKRLPLSAEESEILETLKQAGVSYDMSVEVMSYFIENRRRTEEIREWRERANIRKQALRALGFECDFTESYFSKRLKKPIGLIVQRVYFDENGAETIAAYMYVKKGHEDKGIIFISQNPELFSDLIRYIKIRNDTKAMEKLIKEKRTEMIMGKT